MIIVVTNGQCDLRTDSCSACLRADVPCTGYRDTQQLQIRDETEATERKALIRRSKIISQAPTVSIYERARNVFFFRYVSGFSNSYDVLEPLYKTSSTDGYLVASVDAVGLAFLTFQSGSDQAPQLARAKYSEALSLVQNALVSSGSSTSDAFLLTVLLLDLFEKITGNNPQSTDGWMSHVNGALALLKLRGQEQLQDYTALRLSMRLSTSLIISCIAANLRVPSEVNRLRAQVESFMNVRDPKWKMSGLVVKYADLRGAIQEGSLSNSDIILQSMDLDREFVSLTETMPASWLYRSVRPEKVSERLFEKHYDLYRDHLVTQTWNVLRVMRIFLNDIIHFSICEEKTISSEADVNASLLDMLADTIDSLAREICATAAQYTRCTEASPKKMENFAIESLRCYTLLFPLYTAGLYASPQSNIKPWIVKELRFMGHEIGIRNANVVADILESGDGTSPWSIYAITGSYAFAA